MKQEDKELLLKDLCARLPYGVKGAIFNKNLGFGGISGFEGKYPFVIDGITQEGDDIDVWIEHGNFSLETVKPYLFPISSMTEEQKEEWRGIRWSKLPWEEIEWLNKGHWDYRHLIEKSLAIDATDKNIY